MHVMKREDAEKHGLYTKDPITGKLVPFSTIRFEMTEQEKAEQEKMIASGQVPF